MANQIPLSGATGASGGYLLPDEQGAILTNGLLQANGAISLVGDARATSRRKSKFPIWLGQPTAGFVGEGASKPVTGAEFGQTEMNVKKVASIVLFTEEQIEDVQDGDLNVLVDGGVRSAISDVIDAHILGKDSGVNLTSSFDSMLRSSTATAVELDTAAADGLQKAVSSAVGTLEGNGYGDEENIGVLLGTGFRKLIRDAREAAGSNKALYSTYGDPTYGLDTAFSTNLNTVTEAAGAGKIVGFVVHKPNLHARIRKDVLLKASSEATVFDGTTNRNLFQENLVAALYETRLAFMVHDLNRAVVPIINGA